MACPPGPLPRMYLYSTSSGFSFGGCGFLRQKRMHQIVSATMSRSSDQNKTSRPVSTPPELSSEVPVYSVTTYPTGRLNTGSLR